MLDDDHTSSTSLVGAGTDFDTLIDALLDQPGERRASWLALQTDIPAPVRARLARLLRLDVWIEQKRFMETLPALGQTADSERLGPGTRIGPYVLERELGSGGMSVVWLAGYADQRLHRKVALKLPEMALRRATLEARFARERDILASLEHPHIARLYDAGVDASGRTFLAMEFVDGRPIDRHADEERLDIRARIALFLQAVEAVHFAHQALVVHRDLKPNNIFVNQRGEVRLLDFGIAKLLEPAHGGEATQLTLLDGSPLTPAYAAPEQFIGAPVTTGTDVHALGVVLYRLLTGCLPHRPKRTTRAAFEEAVVEGATLAPSRADISDSDAQARGLNPRRLRSLLAGELDTVVLKALKKLPSERYSSADAFAEDLRRYLRGEPIAAMPDRFGYRFSKFVRRHRLALGLASTTVIAILIAGAIATSQFIAAQLQRQQSVAVKNFLGDILADSEPTDATGPEGVTGRTMIDAGVARAERDFADQPVLRGELLVELGRMYWRHNEKALARTTLERAVQVLEPRVASDSAPLNKGRAYLAFVYNETGDEARAEALARAVIRDCDARDIECAKAVAFAERQMMFSHESRGAITDATTAARRSLNAFRTGYGDAHINTATAWEHLALMLRAEARDTEARAALREALAIADRQPVRQTQRRALEHTAAVLALDAGDYAEAIDRFDKLLGNVPVKEGVNENTAEMRMLYAGALIHQGLPAAALDQADRGIVQSKGVERGPAIEQWSRLQRARALSLFGRHEEAAATLDAVVAYFGADPARRESLVVARRVMGEIAARAGRWSAARQTLLQNLDYLASISPPPSLQLAQSQDLLGVVERALGNSEAAHERHESARKVFETHLGSSHPWTLRNAAYLSLLQFEQTRQDRERGAAHASLGAYLKTFPSDSLWIPLAAEAIADLERVQPGATAAARSRVFLLSH